MRISIILGHPRPDRFNHALARVAAETAARAGHEVHFHDLQAEGFEPVLLPAEGTASIVAQHFPAGDPRRDS